MSQVVFPAISERHKVYADLQKGKIDKKNVQEKFKQGTYVMQKILNRNNAFVPSYVGPFQVVRQNTGAYILQDEEGILMSRNYVASELKAIIQDEVIPKSELFEVEAIIQDNGEAGNREYPVKWKNFSKEHNSWVKAKDFTDTQCIVDYWKKVKNDCNRKEVDMTKERVVRHKRNNIKKDFHLVDYTVI